MPGPWMQSAVANLLDDLRSQRAPQGSPQSRETDGLCCSLPLIARCAVRGDMDLSGVLETVRGPSSLLSSNPFAVTHALACASILRSVITEPGSSDPPLTLAQLQRAVREAAQARPAEEHWPAVLGELEDVAAVLDDSAGDFISLTEKFGKACAQPGSFMGAVLGALRAARMPNAFAAGVRMLVRSG